MELTVSLTISMSDMRLGLQGIYTHYFQFDHRRQNSLKLAASLKMQTSKFLRCIDLNLF